MPNASVLEEASSQKGSFFTVLRTNIISYLVKVYPCKGPDRLRGLQEVEAPRIFGWHMKVATLSAQRTGRLYPPGKIHGTHLS